MKIRKKRTYMLLFLGNLLLSVLLASISTAVASITPKTFQRQPARPFTSSQGTPNIFQNTYVDPDLLKSVGPIRVIIIADDGLPTHEVAQHMISGRITPLFDGFYMIIGVMQAEEIDQLAANPLVLALLKDRKVQYPVSMGAPTAVFSPREALFALPLEESMLGFRDDALMSKPETTLREVVNVTGAQRTWTDLGINGTDVTIAIVDTGVDYGALSLGYWNLVARDQLGYPAAFDADAECMALTNTTVSATYMNDTRKYLKTSGTDPNVYFGLGPLYDTPVVINFSDLTGSPFPADMEITGIRSGSGTYHFGVMVQYWTMVSEWTGIPQLFPVLVVDSTTAGVYDTVYVDLSHDWAWLDRISSEYPDVLPYWPGTWPPEYSFADEAPVTPKGWTIAARDFTGDEIYDLSAGSLGYFLDVWKASPNAADRGLVLKPVDPAGNYTVFVNDWFGHGTYCASSAGGRDIEHPSVGPGVAPGAKIMGITALLIGDIIEAELWAAGFDLIPGTEGWSDLIPGYGWVWGTWNYTGNHKADIISNSWGWSEWAPWLQGLPWYDLMTILEDALMIPGYLDPDYPGTVVVHAGGNGAPGYGTFTSPGYATLPISVGASTSFGTTASSLFGVAGGYFDDVISWSATGPTPLGNTKPDVVNVGAWAWVSGPVWSGLGDGWNASKYFGGTSMATPLTSGSVALLIQGYAEAHGSKPKPETAKVIMKSTAKDLGYDPFLQGSGRVDCFAAVSLALNISGVTIASPATWKNVRSRIQYSWSAAHEFFGEPLRAGPPTEPIYDASWFAGVVQPAGSTSAEFTVTNPANDTITAIIKPVIHKQIGTTTVYSGNTSSLEGWMEGYGDQFIINMSEVPNGADLMVATLTVPYTNFDPDEDYQWDSRFRIFILDWVDTNLDGVVNSTEVFNLNYGYDTGTSCAAKVGFPSSKFKGKPVIWVNQVNQPWLSYAPVPYKVYVSYYKRDSWAWITAPTTIRVGASSSGTFTAKLTVPPGAPQGIYEGQIIVNITDPYTRIIAIPVSLAVPMALPSEDLTMDIVPPTTTELYDPYRVNGHFDWRWRYEAGDWKSWVIDIQDPGTVAAFVSSNWTGARTDIDMFGINPMGILVDGAMSPYYYDPSVPVSVFHWQTRTGTTDEYVVLNTNALANPLTGVCTILLHNVLFDATVFPEEVTGRVELVKLSPRGPINIVTRSNQTVSCNFTISTGRALTNIDFYTYWPRSQFLIETEPTTIPKIDAMGSAEFTVNVHIPENASEGSYMTIFTFSSEEMPFEVAVLLNIRVDNTPPTITILSPESRANLSGNMTLEAYASDPNGIETVEFETEATSTVMSFDDTTGHWIGKLDTRTLSDGIHFIKVVAFDKAGNPVEETLTITVDNTKPSVSITSPADEAELAGNVTVAFTASDANLKQVQLIIGKSVYDVTGETTFVWDTTKVGDGSYIIKLVAYDRANNVAETSITVTTVNMRLAIEATRNLYLTIIVYVIGIPMGLIIGIAVAWAILKRKLALSPPIPSKSP